MGWIKTGLAIVGGLVVAKKAYNYAQTRIPGLPPLPRAQAALRVAYSQAVPALQQQVENQGIDATVTPGSVGGKPSLIVNLPTGATQDEIASAAQALPQIIQGMLVQVTQR